ncbi:cAMP-binding protein [Formosa agariphila KMM 3901]|uniref:cAMP-binding protein n=1 Tax=Formosa agariphila (strain DSM 15362 / KCTC 12365 / LMG 23005 / KMM 3901 / M-2Alg 35-1) TaxID=1347342 RepID=T2KQV9_FORAG|nr:Crp/Fnr family transcriptional regulator [Formosa agariphila]CDF80369.1 cAMP-binding protein [Formosa agariphila KMM 3901]
MELEHFSDLINRPDAKTKHYKKGQILQFAGDEQAKLFYVKSGLLRSYIIDEKGKEHIFDFSHEGHYISDVESRQNNIPTSLFIDTIEDSEVISVPLEKLSPTGLSPELIFNEFTDLALRMGILQRRLIMLISEPARNRYTYFIETFPEAVERIPLKMIASYLGITPEVLSKIRGEIARGK